MISRLRGAPVLSSLLAIAAFLAMLPIHARAQSHLPDANFHDSFDGWANGPSNDADAARFLTQATFGPTAADITHLRVIGYQGWLNEQFAATASTQTQYLDWVSNTHPDEYLSDDTRLEIWSINAAGTADPSRAGFPNNARTDQLRQRVAFALSEIFVVSSNSGALRDETWGLADYYDLLAADAFVNYRQLLEDVTKHPVMGIYLSSIQNQKADDAENIHPDENYAREVMQLFSVGLNKLDTDGTPLLSGGQPIATYDQATVRGFAAVFTGWDWNNAGCDPNSYDCCSEETYFYCGPNDRTDVRWRKPMQPVEVYHDNTTDKQLLNYSGATLANGVLPHSTAQSELTSALDNISRHPNVGPFIATRLIQRLVTSNPTPAYVKRVALVFNADSGGVRGNLKAVVKAILLDPEARYGQWQHPDTFGKLREPLLKATHLWRAMAGRSTSGRVANLRTYPGIEDLYGQAPMRSPTVFNFFKPDFRQPGEITTRGLVSPEFQILSDTMAVETPNNLYHQVFCDYTGSDSCWGSDDPATLQLDEAADAALAASNPAQLVDEYSLLLMSGQMSPFMRSVLITRLNAVQDDPPDRPLGRTRVQHLLYLIMNSPEYSIQK
ncbi:MAG: DUF1800 family protein [Dokdonella sp.]